MDPNKLRVLLTGSTGMIGQGVLIECMHDPRVESITLINRRPLGIKHPKIKEVIVHNLINTRHQAFELGYPNACFHCMGVSSIGMREDDYVGLTYGVTKVLVDLCFDLNHRMTFSYVSGTGTDSTEKGKIMWARVKGRAENYILTKGFGKVFMFRPGFVIPEGNIRSRTKAYDRMYRLMRPIFPLLKRMGGVATTTTRIGQAMINTAMVEEQTRVYLENSGINQCATGKYRC